MKHLDKAIVILFTVCLILVSVLAPISIIITRESYYKNQLINSGVYAKEGETVTVKYISGDVSKRGEFTSAHFDAIIDHFIAYFSNQKESFALELDEIEINGEMQNDVSIFGNEAVTHMDHVRQLFGTVKLGAILCGVLILGCGIYMFVRKEEVRKIIYKYSLGTVLCFFGAFAVFAAIAFVMLMLSGDRMSATTYFNQLWSLMHHIFFPFNPEKFNGSFFNDTLTQILNLDFFINTVFTLVINLVAFTASWLFSAKLISRR